MNESQNNQQNAPKLTDSSAPKPTDASVPKPVDASAPKPTDAEVEILSVLWQRGPSAVRDVHDAISANGRPVGYTTVLKQMQMMFEKGLLRRDESQRAHVYAAVYGQEQTQRQLVGELLDRAFAGSAMNLVMQALATKRASAEELSQIRELLDEQERGVR